MLMKGNKRFSILSQNSFRMQGSGLEMWFSLWNACLAPAPCPARHGPDVVEHVCHPGTREGEAAGAEVQGHPLLHSKFETNLAA